MRKYLSAIISLIFFCIIFANTDNVYAADATISVSSGTVEEGSNVSVDVTISYGTMAENAYQVQLNYDREILEFVDGDASGGDGVLYMSTYASASANETIKLTFKAKKAGASAITIAENPIVADKNEVLPDNIIIKNGTVTVTAKVTSSSNNYLSTLEVVGVREDGSTQAYNITQRETNVVGFDKNQVKYMGYVATDIVKFAVTALPEDNTATVNITGVDLAEGGANVTTITVTAQNGEVRTYTINTYRVPSEGDDEPETPVEPETPSETETPSEPESETTAPVLVDKEVTIGNDIYVVTSIAEDVAIPEGFSRSDYTYDGQVYVAAKGEAKKLIIMQLVKKGTEEKALYVYDDVNNVFYKFVNIQIINKMYTVTEKPEEVEIPADFEETLVNIEGEMLNIWASKAEDGIYLFYGMNWNGEEGLYLYDSKEKTAMRYLALTSSEVSNTVTPEPDNTADETTGNVADNTDASKKNIIIIAEAGIIVVLVIVIIIMIIKGKNPDLDDDDEDEGFDDDNDDEKKDDDILTDEELAQMDADAEEDEMYEESEEADELDESVNIEKAFDYIMEMEAAAEETKTTAEEIDVPEAVAEEDEEEPIPEPVTEGEEEPIPEPVTEDEEEPVPEPVAEIEEEPVPEPAAEVEEETITEPVSEPEKEKSQDLSPSIEEMLMDSSTSLNDDELDMVLDKLLSDE